MQSRQDTVLHGGNFRAARRPTLDSLEDFPIDAAIGHVGEFAPIESDRLDPQDFSVRR